MRILFYEAGFPLLKYSKCSKFVLNVVKCYCVSFDGIYVKISPNNK